MTKSDYYRAVLLGVVVGMSLLTLFCMVDVALDTKNPQQQPQSNFTVVDTYKGCDLVKWTDNQLAEYKYFLYCPK